jgi:hypothetical protein
MGFIAGVAVACLAAVSAVALAVWLSRRRKQPEASDLVRPVLWQLARLRC